MTTSGWEYFLGGAEATGYVEGDVAATWNEYAAQSDLHLDNASDAIEANNDALWEAANASSPAEFDAAAASATASFDATFQNQLASLGLGTGVDVPGANDAELAWGSDPFDATEYDSQVDGF